MLDWLWYRWQVTKLRYGSVFTRQTVAESLGHLGERRAVMPLIGALQDSHGVVRAMAAAALGNLGDDRAVLPLILLMKDHFGTDRFVAAEALGKLGDSRAVEPLIDALRPGGADVSVVTALGRLGDSRAVMPLTRLLDAWRLVGTSVCVSTAEALGRLRDPRAFGRLVSAIQYCHADVRKAAADAIVQLDAPESIQPLIDLLGHHNDAVRITALDLLNQMGDTRAVQPLVALLDDGSQEVRKKCVSVLKRLGWEFADAYLRVLTAIDKRDFQGIIQEGEFALSPLIGALDGSDEVVVAFAAEALGRLGDSRAVKPLSQVISKTWNRRESVVNATIEALGKLDSLAEMIVLLRDSSQQVRKAAATVLKSLRWEFADATLRVLTAIDERCMAGVLREGTAAFAPLIVALDDENRSDFAAEALGELGDCRAVEPLIEALDRYPYNACIKVAAAKALGRLGDSRAVQPLTCELEHDAPSVRLSAAVALAQLRDPGACKPLIAALEEENEDLRNAATKALVQLGDPGAIEPLVELLGHYDEAVIKAAADALIKLGDSRVVPAVVAALEDGSPYASKALLLDVLNDLKWELADATQRALTAIENRNFNGVLQEGAAAVAPLIGALADFDSEGSTAFAAEALGRLGAPAAALPLWCLLSRDFIRFKHNVLEAVKNALVALGPSAVEALIEGVEWSNSHGCPSGTVEVELLGRLGDRRAVGPLITCLQCRFDDTEENLHSTTGWVLYKLMKVDPASIPTDQLRAVCNLSDFNRTMAVYSRDEHELPSVIERCSDLSYLRSLARQELLRRGEG